MISTFDAFRLDDHVALITGANRGIGACIAKEFSAAGATVWVGGRDVAKAEAVASQLEGAHATQLDVGDATSVKSAMMTIRKVSGQLDVLVNNAGLMRPAMIATTSKDDLDAMMKINIKGAFLSAQIAARMMVGKRSGSIINVTSIMGREGAAGFSAYAATKAALIGMTQSMARELAPHNVRVNALAPGFIETDLTNGIQGEARDLALSGIAMGRFGTVEDVAKPARFLACPASAYITGQVLGIDGAMRV